MEFILLDFIFKIASNLLVSYLNWTSRLLLQSTDGAKCLLEMIYPILREVCKPQGMISLWKDQLF